MSLEDMVLSQSRPEETVQYLGRLLETSENSRNLKIGDTAQGLSDLIVPGKKSWDLGKRHEAWR